MRSRRCVRYTSFASSSSASCNGDLRISRFTFNRSEHYRSNMARRDLIERVLAGLPAMSDSVAYPDHPLLLRGPDILASIDSRLTAYFILDRPVHRIPVRLLSDVVLSRLALPMKTSFVLILGPNTKLGVVMPTSLKRLPKYHLISWPAFRLAEFRSRELLRL